MGNLCCGHSQSREPLPQSIPTPIDIYESTDINLKSFRIERVRLIQVLGKGAFGKVLLVSKLDSGQLYAMKVIHKAKLKSNQLKANAVTERKILERVQSPFVVKLHYAFQTSEKLYMVLDYMEGGELFYHLRQAGRFTEDRARFYAAEILLALDSLHKMRIIYRDLKPENVLFDSQGHVKLADFNLSKLVENGVMRTFTFCGTPEYLAPEVLRGEPQDKAMDFWALPYFSPEAKDLLRRLLQISVRVTQRVFRLSNVAEIQRHPFFADINWSLLMKRELSPPSHPSSVSTESQLESAPIPLLDESPQVHWSTPEKQANVFERFTYRESMNSH